MHEDRRLLRSLLRALLAEREDASSLYVPTGVAGMRRMIRALLDLRPPKDPDPLSGMIESFMRMDD